MRLLVVLGVLVVFVIVQALLLLRQEALLARASLGRADVTQSHSLARLRDLQDLQEAEMARGRVDVALKDLQEAEMARDAAHNSLKDLQGAEMESEAAQRAARLNDHHEEEAVTRSSASRHASEEANGLAGHTAGPPPPSHDADKPVVPSMTATPPAAPFEEASGPAAGPPPPSHDEKPVVPSVTAPPPATAPLRVDLSALSRMVVVVLAHDRVDSLRECLAQLTSLREFKSLFRVAVSLDAPGSYDVMTAVARPHTVWRHTPAAGGGFAATSLSKISRHVYAALSAAFEIAEYALLIEDDLRPAPDFLRYFSTAAAYLSDDDVWCVSAWNDNAGRSTAGWRPESLLKTTYFPGLGWMLQKATWLKLQQEWPTAPTTGWDHWIRAGSPVRKLSCVYPELPRVRHAPTTNSANVRGAEAVKFQKFAFAANHDGDYRFADMSLAKKHVKVADLPSKEDVVVVASLPEDLGALASRLGIWSTEPRGFSKDGVALVRTPTATVLVVDSRFVEGGGLPPDARITRAKARDVSCEAACASEGNVCVDALLRFADDCDTLLRFFECEGGCGHQLGAELPAHVEDRRQPTFQQCLLQNGGGVPPKCKAHHASTTRLCVCVPRR